jgi:hypothetical protein
MTDDELKKRHGDHAQWSIQKWRGEVQSGETELEYIDWRADKLWCAAMDSREAH